MSERKILAIDPGSERSAFVLYCDGEIQAKGILSNEEMRTALLDLGTDDLVSDGATFFGAHLVVEMIASYGMSVGAEVFATCLWVGRFIEAWGGSDFSLMYRAQVKMHLCQTMRAKDGNIRQALLDKLGPQGTKQQPGPTYGVKADLWAALAVAVTFAETGAA